MKISLRYAAVIAALLFVTSARPIHLQAAGNVADGCYACEMCYPEMSCLSCGVLALTAISGCCGMGNGDTYCVPDYGGFAVNCSSGRACQCEMDGEGCDPLLISG